MRAVIRTYSGPGAKKLFVELEKNKAKIQSVIGGVKGLVSYSLVSTTDGGMSVTVCEDQNGRLFSAAGLYRTHDLSARDRGRGRRVRPAAASRFLS